MRAILIVAVLAFVALSGDAKGQPWRNPLRISVSNDGTNFTASNIFQDSAGVPSVIRWKGDTLACAFQWFRQPNPSASWDPVAVKFSYDAGLTWTVPAPIIVTGLPAGYQRPFDPTLCAFANDSLRIFFSSSATIPMGGLDSAINTYSAKSADGIHYLFEPGPRVDEVLNRVIDPAIVYFNSFWHYTAPIGSPQQGAYHYTSPDGLNFTPQPAIPSDNNHNWTGNLMVNNGNELRFYGCGSTPIWFASSTNGGSWGGYISTNVQGGDPSVTQLGNGSYLMIYVGQPYANNIGNVAATLSTGQIYPNPSSASISVAGMLQYIYSVYDFGGKLYIRAYTDNNRIPIESLKPGVYSLEVQTLPDMPRQRFSFIKN